MPGKSQRPEPMQKSKQIQCSAAGTLSTAAILAQAVARQAKQLMLKVAQGLIHLWLPMYVGVLLGVKVLYPYVSTRGGQSQCCGFVAEVHRANACSSSSSSTLVFAFLSTHSQAACLAGPASISSCRQHMPTHQKLAKHQKHKTTSTRIPKPAVLHCMARQASTRSSRCSAMRASYSCYTLNATTENRESVRPR